MSHAARRAYEDASARYFMAGRLLSDTRTKDVEKIADEAHAVGFHTACVGYFGENTDNGFRLLLGGVQIFNVALSLWPGSRWTLGSSRGIAPAHWLSETEIDQLGLTPDQIFFLNWSSEWETEIWAFWSGKTDFETIEEFIQYLKDTATNIYTHPNVKSASKTP